MSNIDGAINQTKVALYAETSAGVFTFIGGQLQHSHSRSLKAVDITNRSLGEARVLLSGAGAKDQSISGDILYSNDTAYQFMLAAYNSKSFVNLIIKYDLSPINPTDRVPYLITSINESAGQNAALTSSLSMQAVNTKALPILPSNIAPVANFESLEGFSSTAFTDTSTDVDGIIVAWMWLFDDSFTSTLQNPVHGFASAGTYNVSLKVTDNGGAQDTIIIPTIVTAVNIPPLANFTSLGSGLDVDFTDTSTDVDGTIGAWFWDFDDGSVNVPPVANFTNTSNVFVATFTDTSTDSNGTITDWFWEFGDTFTSVLQNPVHDYGVGGTFNVSLTVTDNDGSQDATIKPVTVSTGNVAPTAGFTHIENALQSAFTDTSTDSDGTITDWLWDFDDTFGSTAQNPVHTFASPGTYSVSLTVTDNGGLQDTIIIPVNVSASNILPVASFIHSSVSLDATFIDTSTDSDGTITDWLWDFDDTLTSTLQHPLHTFAGAGTYSVSLTVTDNSGGQDTVIIQISVSAANVPPVANFTSTENNHVATFTDTSTDADGTITDWFWNFDDTFTSTLQNPVHEFASAGSYNVSLTVTDNGGLQDTIIIPVNAITLFGEVFICDRSEAKFYKIDPATLANLSGAGVSSPGTGPNGIGGTNSEVFNSDQDTDKFYKIDPVTLANLSGAGVTTPGDSLQGLGGTSTELFTCGFPIAPRKILKIDPVTLANLSGGGIESPGFSPSGIGGSGSGEVFHCDLFTDKFYKIDPVTLANLSGSGVTTPGVTGSGIGGTASEIFHCDQGTDRIYKIDPVTMANLSGAGVATPGSQPTGIGGTKT